MHDIILKLLKSHSKNKKLLLLSADAEIAVGVINLGPESGMLSEWSTGGELHRPYMH